MSSLIPTYHAVTITYLPPTVHTQDLHSLLLCHSLADHEVARYQVIQVMVRMARTELVGTSGTSLHLGSTAEYVNAFL